MTTIKRATGSKTRLAACLAGWLIAASSAFGDPLLPPVEHSDCIIEPTVVVEVGTSVAGVIEQMLVERSDRVERGQPLARLESSVEQVSVRRSRERAEMRSEIRARQADLALARQKMQRIEDLYARKVVSKQQRDEAVNELERADQAVKIAREKLHLAKLDLEHARAQLERRVIRSPISGVVLERLAQAGEYVDERPLLTLAQLDPLRVEVLMPAQSFGSIRPGMAAEVMPELAAKVPLEAEVVLVDPIIDTASGTFGVRLELPNVDYAIPSGMRCRVSFQGMNATGEELTADSAQSLDDAGFLAARTPPPPSVEWSDASEPGPALPTLPDDGAIARSAPPVVVPASQTAAMALPPEDSAAADLEPAPALGSQPASTTPPGQRPDTVASDSNRVGASERPETASAPPAGAESAMKPSELCWRLGPWSDRRSRDAVAARLDRVGARCEPRQEATATRDQWMVYVPGRGGRDTADQLARLAQAGYQDLYVIRRGQQRGDVSVGLYNSRRNALKRKGALAANGFETRIARHAVPLKHYWLSVSGVDPREFDAIDELAAVPRESTACSDREGGVLYSERPAGEFVSRAE